MDRWLQASQHIDLCSIMPRTASINYTLAWPHNTATHRHPLLSRAFHTVCCKDTQETVIATKTSQPALNCRGCRQKLLPTLQKWGTPKKTPLRPAVTGAICPQNLLKQATTPRSSYTSCLWPHKNRPSAQPTCWCITRTRDKLCTHKQRHPPPPPCNTQHATGLAATTHQSTPPQHT